MHPRKKSNLSITRRQHGATLVLSLLLVAILTMLATTAMQSSYLSYKSQISRLGYQRNVSELNLIQRQAAKRIKGFIDSRGEAWGIEEQGSDGFLLLDDILSLGNVEPEISTEDEALISLMSYVLPQMQVDVYITKSRLSTSSVGSELLQHKTYDHVDRGGLSERRYLYLQLHCIKKVADTQNQSIVHVVGDFRFEVS